MAFPLGLGLYLFATARRARPVAEDAPPPPSKRPAGPLLWVPAPKGAALPGALTELIHRLLDVRPDVTVLVTAPGTPALPEGAILAPPPAETLPDLKKFLAFWQPALVVLWGGHLPPAIIHESYLAHIPVHLIDARPPPPGRPPRLPGVVSTLLQRLDLIVAPDRATARALRRLGAPEALIEVTGHLQGLIRALPHVEAEREALAWLARSRPIWLAAGLPEAEEEAVIDAHRAALRLAHRLLLIVVPADLARGRALVERMEASQGWTVALRSADEEPEDDAQAYIADTEGEMGLWYRLAPITFLGGSLMGTGCTRSPNEPAALGSSIIAGPRGGAHFETLFRLDRAGATRPVARAAELGPAIAELLAPDRAALIAHNAWEVTTAGSEVTDHVVRRLVAALPAATAPVKKARRPREDAR